MEELDTPLRWSEEAASIGSNEQKIEANKARIEELKAERDNLLTRKRNRELAASRAKMGDFSFAQTLLSNESSERIAKAAEISDNKIRADKELEDSKMLLREIEKELRKIDNKLSGNLSDEERRGAEDERNQLIEQRDKLVKANPGLVMSYVSSYTPGSNESVVELDKQWSAMMGDFTEDDRDQFLNRLVDYEDRNGPSGDLEALRNKVKQSRSREQKSVGYETRKREAKKAIERLGRDRLQSRLYDKVKDKKVRNFNYEGKSYSLDKKDNWVRD